MKSTSICTIDIETLPGTYRAFVDKWWKTRVMKEDVPVKLASFGWKELHMKRVYVIAYWEFKTYDEFLQAVWDVCDAHAYVIGHNAKQFDLRQLHSFFAAHGFSRPRCQVLDTLKAVRKEFRLPQYRLKYVAPLLGVGNKIDTGGEELWFQVEAGDEKARQLFVKYNANDVLITDLMFKRLVELGYMKMPYDRQLFTAKYGCIRCGHDEMQKKGEKPYSDGMYQMVRCKNCNKHQPFYLLRKWAHKG